MAFVVLYDLFIILPAVDWRNKQESNNRWQEMTFCYIDVWLFFNVRYVGSVIFMYKKYSKKSGRCNFNEKSNK